MKRYVKYIKAEGPDCNALKCEVYYNLGGINYFTYKTEQRGYYVSVSPVERKGNCESYIGFSGIKNCVLPVNRQSKKAEEAAISMMDKAVRPLIDYVTKLRGIKLLEEYK